MPEDCGENEWDLQCTSNDEIGWYIQDTPGAPPTGFYDGYGGGPVEGTQVAIELGACLPPAGGSYACIQDPLPCRPQASGNYVLAIDGPDNPPYWKLQS